MYNISVYSEKAHDDIHARSMNNFNSNYTSVCMSIAKAKLVTIIIKKITTTKTNATDSH